MQYHQLPKIELHIHLDCSLSYEVVQQLDPTVTLSQYQEEFIAPEGCSDLLEYIRRSAKGYTLMQTQEQLRLVTLDFLEQMDRDHVIYVEIRFAPLLHTQKGLTPAQVITTIQAALQEGSSRYKVIPRLIFCTLRDYSEEQSMETVKLAEQFMPQGWVVGFDIAGDEAGYPVTAHEKAFAYAHEKGIPCTAHAGEACGASSVWEVLRHFHPSRIGHGVRSVEDPALLEYLKQHQIHLEICPSSNLRTNIFKNIAVHSLPIIYKAGISISVNTDARTVTPVTLSSEYELVATTFGWTLADFLHCNLEAVKHSFASNSLKAELTARLQEAYS
jgi:adenosine deaminase